MKKNIFLILIICFNCTQIETDTTPSDRLTVEGQISENKFAKIYLTNSLPFRGIIDSLEVAKSIESKAKVVLSDGEVSEVLTLKRDDSNFPFLFYRSNIIKGELEKDYYLSISIRGKEFTSNTSIPEKIEVLNIEFSESTKDGIITPEFKDIKLTIDNKTQNVTYFKILIKNKKESKFELARPFIFNTENVFTDSFPLVVTHTKTLEDGEIENQLKAGEDIELKIVGITKEQFNFWKSIKGDITSPLGDSSFTNNTKSNISNNAFGYWSGEDVTVLNFKIP